MSSPPPTPEPNAPLYPAMEELVNALFAPAMKYGVLPVAFLWLMYTVMGGMRADIAATSAQLHEHVTATQSILDVQRTLLNVVVQDCANNAKTETARNGCFSALTTRPSQ